MTAFKCRCCPAFVCTQWHSRWRATRKRRIVSVVPQWKMEGMSGGRENGDTHHHAKCSSGEDMTWCGCRMVAAAGGSQPATSFYDTHQVCHLTFRVSGTQVRFSRPKVMNKRGSSGKWLAWESSRKMSYFVTTLDRYQINASKVRMCPR